MGGPSAMQDSVIVIKRGMKFDRNELLRRLVNALYVRNDIELNRGNFRVKGDTVDIFMAYSFECENQEIKIKKFKGNLKREI